LPAGGRQRLLAALLVLPFLLAPLWLGLAHYQAVDQSQNTRARNGWQAILAEPLPADAILISNDRNDIMPLWYFQYVDGRRPDLLGLFPLITEAQPTIGHVLDLALGTGRPTYLIKDLPGIEVKVGVEEVGRLWQVTGPAAQGEAAYGLDASIDGAVRLLGYDRAPRSPRPGETLQISLYWQATGSLDTAYHSYVHLLDGEGNKVAQSDRQPGGVYYPTSLWRPGELLRDDHLLLVPADAAADVYRLVAGMYTLGGDGEVEALGQAIPFGQVAVKGPDQSPIGPLPQPPLANFGGQIELLGYEVEEEEGALVVTLQWQAVEPPMVDYTVFVHLLDGGGGMLAQHDDQPQAGAYPTSVWEVGEVVADPHRLDLPAGLPAEYRLRVGLYRLETGERLPVVGGGDSVELE
jgi:hypothetical protein